MRRLAWVSSIDRRTDAPPGISHGARDQKALPAPAETAADRFRAERRAALVAEARKFRLRQLRAEAVASRCVPGRFGMSSACADAVRRRVDRRADAYQARFLHALDRLFHFDGFDDAMALLQELRRSPRADEPPALEIQAQVDESCFAFA